MTYEIVTKYIKDLSFKINDAKSYFLLEKDIKNYSFVCDIKSKKLKEKIVQADINLRLISVNKTSNRNLDVKVELTSIIQFDKVDNKDEMEKRCTIQELEYKIDEIEKKLKNTPNNPKLRSYWMRAIKALRKESNEILLTYLANVKIEFDLQPHIYTKFLDIMKKFKAHTVDKPGVIQQVLQLFRGHDQLILDFNASTFFL